MGETVGLIGPGLMGYGIARNLIEAGYDVRVLAHRRREKVEDLLARGASEATSMEELVRGAGIVLCCLPTVETIEAVIGGPGGVLDQVDKGTLVIDCSTGTPAVAQAHEAQADARGADFVDAPLMKGPKQALEGTLNVIIGAEPRAYSRAEPVLRCFSAELFHVGPVGSGCTIKLLNQGIGLGTHAVVCEAFAIATKLGLDLEAFRRIVGSGQATSKKFEALGGKFSEGDYGLNFALATALKDIGLCERMARDADTYTPVLGAAHDLFALNARLEDADGDVSTMGPFLGRLAGIDFAEVASRKRDKGAA